MASLDFKMNIVAVGKTGSGKSSTLNSIATLIGGLSTPPFSANSGVNSVTSSIELVSIKTNDGKAVQLVDTVGLFDTNLTKKLNFLDHIDECSASLLIELAKLTTLCADGIHAILFTIAGNSRFTLESQNSLKTILDYFGSKVHQNLFYIVTHGDEISEEQLIDLKRKLGKFLVSNRNQFKEDRMFVVNNLKPDRNVLLKILQQIEENAESEGPYTHSTFVEAQKALEEFKNQKKLQIEQKLQIAIEEEKTNIEAKYQLEIVKLKNEMRQQMQKFERISDENSEQKLQQESVVSQLNAKIAKMENDREKELEKVAEVAKNQLQSKYESEIRQLQERLGHANQMVQNDKAELQRLAAEIQQMRSSFKENDDEGGIFDVVKRAVIGVVTKLVTASCTLFNRSNPRSSPSAVVSCPPSK